MPVNSDRSFTEVVGDIVGNVQGIIRSEVRLAKTEMREEAVAAGKAGGIAGAGAALAFYALGFLLLTCVYALEIALAAWLSALLVAVGAGVIGATLIYVGRKRLRQVPAPRKTIETIKENVEWAKQQTK